MKYDTILFDADMTLFDFRKAEEYALEETFLSHGCPFTPEIRERYIAINEDLWRSFEQGKISREYLMSSRFTLLFQELGLAVDGILFNQEYLDHLGQHPFLLNGALELCRTLSRHCRLYIATNGVTNTQKNRLRLSEIRPFITDIFVSEETGSQKPLPGYFQYVAGHIPGWNPQRTLMVGDSLTSDIQGALNAGIPCCWFNPDFLPFTLKTPCTYEIHQLSQLVPIILGQSSDIS